MAIIIIGRGGYGGDITGRLVRLEKLTHGFRQVAAADVFDERDGWKTPRYAVYTTRNPFILYVDGDRDELLSLLASMRHGWMPASDLGHSPTVGGWLQSIADGCWSAAQ